MPRVERAKGASRFYDADDEPKPLHRNHKPRSAKLRQSIKAGTVLIVLAGRFRGKRVVFLKQLESGLLLVTGPYKLNGVPLRRLNQAYVIATSKQMDISGVDVSDINDDSFAREETAAPEGEEGFLTKESIPAVVISDEKKARQAKADSGLLSKLNKTEKAYLKSKFTLRKGQYPHMMSF